ncbi:MAG: hypothetical protein KME13_17235 [Myxacorys californica WJT36-NPBG1]|nr:hypothetical protein [Myxacorys californica WJT36-NPBG1]
MQCQAVMLGFAIGCTVTLPVGLFATTPLAAQPASGGQQIPVEAQLTSHQKQLLKAVGLKIAVPTYVPRGFTLDKVVAQVDRQSRIGGMGYTVFYRRYDSDSNKDFCFAIEATNGGIGDLPEGSRSFPINSPTFGKSSLEYGKYGGAKSPTYLSSWLGEEKGPFYRFVGAGVLPGLSTCSNISAQEAIRVTQSLRYQN